MPFPTVYSDFLEGLPAAPSHLKADVKVAERLCFSVVRFKCIIAREDHVKADILIKEDVIP